MLRAIPVRVVSIAASVIGLGVCLLVVAMDAADVAGSPSAVERALLLGPLFVGMLLISAPLRRPPIAPVLLGMLAFLAIVFSGWQLADTWLFIRAFGTGDLCPIGQGQARLFFWSAAYAGLGGGLLLPFTARRGRGWRAFGWWSGAFLAAFVSAGLLGLSASEDWYQAEGSWSLFPPPCYALFGAASASAVVLTLYCVLDIVGSRAEHAPDGWG